ncbi:MAG: 30S ribosomal protein S8e [Candidatus Aenigmatarchaeota archaeon]
MQWQLRSMKKPSGKLLKKNSKKKRFQRGRDYLPTHIGNKSVVKLRTKGAGEKRVALKANIANVSVNGNAKKAKIITVVGNAADAQFIRRNIITKGAIIQTDIGNARVTSRPGQSGVVNAVLIEQTPKASDSHASKEEKK